MKVGDFSTSFPGNPIAFWFFVLLVCSVTIPTYSNLKYIYSLLSL
jgi:hypothetical protein